MLKANYEVLDSSKKPNETHSVYYPGLGLSELGQSGLGLSGLGLRRLGLRMLVLSSER